MAGSEGNQAAVSRHNAWKMGAQGATALDSLKVSGQTVASDGLKLRHCCGTQASPAPAAKISNNLTNKGEVW